MGFFQFINDVIFLYVRYSSYIQILDLGKYVMKNLIWLTLVTLFLYHSAGYAESYSEASTVTALTLGANGIRVKLNKMKSVESCVTQDYYYLDTPDDDRYDKLVSALMAAKVSQQKLSFQFVGCSQVGSKSYPKISHIYFCDTSFCS